MTREELLRSVIENPDLDEPRRAFAKWGRAAGDPQAEFAHLQLLDAEERRKYGRPGQHARAAAALLAQHEAAWSRDVLKLATQPRFFRGFIEAVTMDAPTFLARAPELYAIAPIRAVAFVDAASHVAAIADSPHIARLVSIQFYNRSQASPLDDDGLRRFLASPHLGKLAMLSVPFNEISRAGMEALAAARLPSLRYAALANNRDDSPVEEYAVDSMSGVINNNSIELPAFGKELEAKYGEQAWLHAPSLLRVFPPNEGDF